MSDYLGLLILTILSAGFFIGMILISIFLGPKNKTATKQLPFECGAVSVGEAKNQRFGVRFYLVAMIFILFDIEIVFMYPWAVQAKELGASAFYAVFSFIALLSVGLIYIWKKGILDWNE